MKRTGQAERDRQYLFCIAHIQKNRLIIGANNEIPIGTITLAGPAGRPPHIRVLRPATREEFIAHSAQPEHAAAAKIENFYYELELR